MAVGTAKLMLRVPIDTSRSVNMTSMRCTMDDPVGAMIDFWRKAEASII